MTLCSLRLLPTLRGRNNLSFDIKLKSEKYLLMEISRGEKRHWGMKKEKKKGQRRKKEYHSIKKIGKSLMKATGTPLHAGVQMRSPSNQN